MVIPSIDLQGGRIVQLVQGERLALASSDVDGWVRRFEGYPEVQLIDLDAARGEGTNTETIERIASRLPCRVGGGIRSVERALAALGAGAQKVILGSALFTDDGVNLTFAESVFRTIGPGRLIAAIDAKAGRVAVHGWRKTLPLTPESAIKTLGPFVNEFLFTNVDREGRMQGIDRKSIARLRAATGRRLTVAGGVTTADEVKWLESLEIDAVVGMALYTGRLEATPPPAPPSNRSGEDMR